MHVSMTRSSGNVHIAWMRLPREARAVEHVIQFPVPPPNLAMSAPLDLLAGVVAQEEAVSLVSSLSGRRSDANSPDAIQQSSKRMKIDNPHPSDKSCSSSAASNPELNDALAQNGTSSPTQGDFCQGALADSKRALRAERNRQSAAASRERKKRHMKELENHVQYLSDLNTALQYRAHMDQKAWNEKEQQLEHEISKLKQLLTSAQADNRELRNLLDGARNPQG